MAIPETQLDTWSHQGSITQSRTTYQTIKDALFASEASYADKDFNVFLQGSYGNDTNIYAESDIDVVIRLDSIFRSNIRSLSLTEQQSFDRLFSDSTYTFSEFKEGVLAVLIKRFGKDAVKVGSKAITILADGSRRKADVVVCRQYRHYVTFDPAHPDNYTLGIIFPTASGDIVNYPKQHSDNLTTQHQNTSQMLKPMVRILKNIRSYMVDKSLIEEGVAPSYYLECLFYNVPPEQYKTASFSETFCAGINWIHSEVREHLLCANKMYSLLGDSNVQWNDADLSTFLAKVCKLWKEW